MKTSTSHPIRVDTLPALPELGAGRLGLTFAPGKKDASSGWDRDLGADLDRLRTVYRTDLLVSLVEDHELELLQIPSLFTEAEACGLRVRRFPIVDVSVPEPFPDFLTFVAGVCAELWGGHMVTVHCRGGLGRAGLTAASCLAYAGIRPARAIDLVRDARPGAIETAAQEQVVFRVAKSMRALSNRTP